jgi:hypothetical protein
MVIAAAGCGTVHLPPPPPPTADVADIPVDAPPGTVEIESDRPAAVDEVTGVIYAGGPRPIHAVVMKHHLCDATPCSVQLSNGPHDLQFAMPDSVWGGSMRIAVGPRPSVLRYAVGHSEVHPGGQVFGTVMLIMGGVATMVALPVAVDESINGAWGRGTAATLGSLAVFVIGAVLSESSRPEVQNGAGVQVEAPLSP